MKWWDFKDINFITFFFIMCALLLALIFIILTLIIFNVKSKNVRKLIQEESNTIRIYIVDVKKEIVTFFNRSDLKNKRSINLSDFYSKFHFNDVEKVKNWIFSICVDVNSVDPYLEADILIKHHKNPYFSLLKLLKYDVDKGLIFIESHILKYITPTNQVKRKNNKTTRHSYGVLSSSAMKNLINNNRSIKGYTFAVKFFYMRQKDLTNEKVEQYMAFTLKNCIYPFASNYKIPRQIVDNGVNELYLFDLHLSNNDEAMRLANSLSRSLNKAIGVNGFSNSITFSIGVVANSSFYKSYDDIVSVASETAISAHQNDQSITLFIKSNMASKKEFMKYEEEINNLLKPNAIRYLFRPIINVNKKKIIGYFSYAKAYDTSFSSLEVMNRYANKVNKGKDLFIKLAKGIIPKFANEIMDERCRLFFNISLDNLANIKEILPQITNQYKLKLVLVFDEQEINQNAVKLDLFNEQMFSIHNLGYEIGLSMKDRNLLLDPSIYNNFDFFIAGYSLTGEIKKNSRNRLSIHTLIEKLLKYKKPIIATDLEGWSAVELIIKSGINYISSEVISSSNDMLLPIDKKKMDKIALMADKYRF